MLVFPVCIIRRRKLVLPHSWQLKGKLKLGGKDAASETEMETKGVNMAVELVNPEAEEPWLACRLARKEMPIAIPGTVVVRMLCRPINPSDIACITGAYLAWQPTSNPPVLGFEGMGVIHQVGEGVSGFDIGQRVFPIGASDQGLWQDFIVAPAAGLIPMPPWLPDDVAAQFFINPWTVVGILEVLKVPKEDYFLQTAAASVLGRMLIQYAHHQGIKTINIVRRRDQVEELKALGADEVIVCTEEDVEEKVKLVTGGRMAHSAADCVGGDTTDMVTKCVRDGSTVIVYGALGDPFAKVSIGVLVFKNITLQGFYLRTWIHSLTQSQVKEVGSLVMSLFEKKVITPLVGEKFPLHKFQEAIQKSMEAGRGGKVLLVSS